MAGTLLRPMRTLPLLLVCVLASACTAELKEQNNDLEEKVLLLQGELAQAENARGEMALQLKDLQTGYTRLESAVRFGFDLEQRLWAVLETSLGELVCELYPAEAPMTVDNFIKLSRGEKEWFDRTVKAQTTRKLYDNTTFHRVVPGKLVQGGSPTGGSGFSPGWFFADEIHPERKIIPGAMAMANSGPDKNATQFFITYTAHPELDGHHTVFGGCEPLSVLKDLVETPTEDPESERPAVPPRLDRVTIHQGDRPSLAAQP